MTQNSNLDLTSIAKLFKAYDLRGTYPLLSQDIYYWMGQGLIKTVFEPENLGTTLAVFRDHRYTSPIFYKALCNGITDAGGTVIPLDLGTTDLMYAATQCLKVPGAIVTASHNPKDDNGCKVVKGGSTMLGLNSGLDKVRDFVIEKLASGENYELMQNFEEDTVTKTKVIEFYEQKLHLIGSIEETVAKLNQRTIKFKVVVDCGNGMGGYIMNSIKKVYGNSIEFVDMYFELDGTYPNHPADPSNPANIVELRARVVSEQADLGVAFDGDADRAYFVDETGEFMEGNFVVSEFAKQFLKEIKTHNRTDFNPAIVYSQPQSRCQPVTILENDGIPIQSKQGHIFIKASMAKYNAIYGGEASGHHYYGDFGFMDGGALTMAKMIQILTEKNKKPSELIASYKKMYYLSGEQNFRLADDANFDEIKAKVKAEFADATFSEMDGLTAYYRDWKVNCRMSNTEPLLRINIETIGSNQIQAKLSQIKSVLDL